MFFVGWLKRERQIPMFFKGIKDDLRFNPDHPLSLERTEMARKSLARSANPLQCLSSLEGLRTQNVSAVLPIAAVQRHSNVTSRAIFISDRADVSH